MSVTSESGHQPATVQQSVNLFFSPFAYIWPHERLELAFQRQLKAKGERVVVVRCSGQCWSFCHVKHAVGPAERALGTDLCLRCKYVANGHFRSSDVHWLKNPHATSSSAIGKDQSSMELVNRLKRYVTHDFLLTGRKRLADLSEFDRRAIENSVHDAVAIHQQVRRLVKRESVTRIFYYNDVYAVNLIARDVAEEFGLERVNLNLSMIPRGMHDRYSVSTSQEQLLTRQRSPRTCPPLDRRQCRELRKTIDFQIYGRSAFLYSEPANRRKDKRKCGISDCVLILSSHDEMQSLKYLFPEVLAQAQYDQRSTIGWFKRLAEQYPDRSFVIRPHPREFSNHRHATSTSHSQTVLDQLTDLPKNLTVDFPEKKIPIFDRIRSTHAVLFTWSSAGLDSLALGRWVACATPDDLTWCPSDLFQTVRNYEDLVDFFDRTLAGPVSTKEQLNALRWYGWFLNEDYRHFSWIPYKWSPSRIIHGVLGRSRRFMGPALLASRSVESLLSRPVNSNVRRSESGDSSTKEDANKLERRLCARLRAS